MIRTLAVLCLLAGTANAQQAPKCFPAAEWLAGIEADYGERVGGQGVGDRGSNSFVLTVNPTTRTWTFGQVTTSGLICPLISGTGWETIPFTKGI